MSNADLAQLIEEYNLDYCYFLEAVYGEGMMSEGGSEAIEAMFEGIDINHKSILDIGSGLGGVGLYLAKNFETNITGIDISPEMVAEAKRRIPDKLKDNLHFQLYDDMTMLPFADASFDIVFSKGVLTHVRDKTPLFNEVKRVLKAEGRLLINDWLSPIDNKWGERLLKMCEMENLTLYAFSEEHYKNILEDAGFRLLNVTDETAIYAKYNTELSSILQTQPHADKFIAKFGETAWKNAHVAYQLIADSMNDKELLVKNLICGI